MGYFYDKENPSYGEMFTYIPTDPLTRWYVRKRTVMVAYMDKVRLNANCPEAALKQVGVNSWTTNMLHHHSPFQNRLLEALPAAEFQRLEYDLELVPMPLGEVLYEPGHQLNHVYFPTTSIVSVVYGLDNGASAEIAIVGNEGIWGISKFMGGNTTSGRAVVQSTGWGYRLKAHLMEAEFTRAGPLFHLLLRYTQTLITQMAQTAVCNRHHCIEQQLCRWLLLNLDRLSSDSLTMTQSLIAKNLGVRREGVTDAAGKLQRAGYIRYARGRITVTDRLGLEQRCCECYAVVKRQFDHLMSTALPGDPNEVLGKSISG